VTVGSLYLVRQKCLRCNPTCLRHSGNYKLIPSLDKIGVGVVDLVLDSRCLQVFVVTCT